MAGPRHFQHAVGTSATALDGTDRAGFMVRNFGSATVFLGASNVTTATGWPVLAGEVWTPPRIVHDQLLSRGSEHRLYGIVASGTVDVRVIVAGRTT